MRSRDDQVRLAVAKMHDYEASIKEAVAVSETFEG